MRLSYMPLLWSSQNTRKLQEPYWYLYMTPHSYACIIYGSIVKLSKHVRTRRALFTVRTEPHTLWENPSQCNPHKISIQDTAFIGACDIVLSSEECTAIWSTFIGACHIVLYCETLCLLCRALETRKPNDPYTLYKRPLYPFEKSPRKMDRCKW